MKHLMLKTAVALAVAAPLMASAESQLATGTANASAKLNLQVTIPRVVFLAVGTGAAAGPLATNATVDTLTFDYTGNPAGVGNGTAAAAQTVAVRVFGNNGQITLASDAATTQLATGGGSTIPLTQLSVSTDDANLAPPAFGGGTFIVNATNNRVTDRTANWSYSYLNQTVPDAGTYSALVTYTATMP